MLLIIQLESLEQENIDIELDYDFNFLAVAQWGPRKNIDNTINWFIEEFHDEEVGLVLKANMANCSTLIEYCIHKNMKSLLQTNIQIENVKFIYSMEI